MKQALVLRRTVADDNDDKGIGFYGRVRRWSGLYDRAGRRIIGAPLNFDFKFSGFQYAFGFTLALAYDVGYASIAAAKHNVDGDDGAQKKGERQNHYHR